MPPAPSATVRSQRLPSTALGAAALRVRWDRVGRTALLLLLLLVGLLYVGPARSFVSTLHRSRAQEAQVQALQREHARLLSQARELRKPATIAAEARRLGMVLPGERPYVVRGLPGD
jgi:cell division protein FtsB